MQTSVAVVGGRGLPSGQLVGDEVLYVLALEVAGEERVTLRLTVGGEEPDGVIVGLDGPRALVLGIQGAPEAPVENQKMITSQLTADGGRLGGRIVPLTRVWWSGWLRGSVLRLAE